MDSWDCDPDAPTQSTSYNSNGFNDSRSGSRRSYPNSYQNTSFSRPSYGGGGPSNDFNSSFNAAPSEASNAKFELASSIKIENLGLDASVTEIRSLFGRYGPITRLVFDYSVEESKATCWLNYQYKEAIENAKKFNMREFRGREITVSDNRDAITTLNTSSTFPSSSASRPSNGFGSRPGGSGCFKCHKEGHMARDCPEAGDSGRGRGRGGSRYQPYGRGGGGGRSYGSNGDSSWGDSKKQNDFSDSKSNAQDGEPEGWGSWDETPSSTPSIAKPASTNTFQRSNDDSDWGAPSAPSRRPPPPALKPEPKNEDSWD